MNQTKSATTRAKLKTEVDEAPKPRAARGSQFVKRAATYLGPHNMLDPCRLMKVNELAVLLNVHPQTVWSWVSKKSHSGFPKPIKLGPQIVVWRAVDVLAWLDSKAAETAPTETATTGE